MIYDGTDLNAFEKASKGKTPEQRSRMYKKQKAKNEKQAKKEEKKKKYIPIKVPGKKKKTKTPTRPLFHSSIKRQPNSICKPTYYKPSISKQQLRIENSHLFGISISQVGEKITEKLIDFTIDLIKEHSSYEIRKAVDRFQTIHNYIKVADNIYKVIVKIDKTLNKASVKYELQENNQYTRDKYKRDYMHHKHTYDKYSELKNIKIVALKDLEEWSFGSDQHTADTLFHLVKQGTKTATSYLLEEQTLKDKNYSHSILTNWNKSEKLLLKTVKTNIVSFKDVTSEHAFKEGEHDRTLSTWKYLHKEFFTKSLAEHGKTFSEDIKIVCEEFQVVKTLNS